MLNSDQIKEALDLAKRVKPGHWLFGIDHFSQMGYERSYWQTVGPRRFQTPRADEDRSTAADDSDFVTYCSPDFIIEVLESWGKMKEVLEWYSDRKNWKTQTHLSDVKDEVVGDTSDTDLDGKKYMCWSGGKRARAVLKEIRGGT